LINPIRVTTPNFNSRHGHTIRLIVLHCDASPSSEATRSWIQSPKSKVSYHLEVERDGTVVRYVNDEDRAWAVGVGIWKQYTDLNTISLSASFANKNDKKEPLTEIQITTMKEIVTEWKQKYPTIEAVVTHASVATPKGRKTDPDYAPNFKIEDYL